MINQLNKIFLLLIIASSQFLFAQKTSLLVAGREFKLNMSKKDVLPMLENVKDTNNVGFDIIIRNKFYGQVFFDSKNKLKYISKEWVLDLEKMDAVKIMSTLFSIFKTFNDNKDSWRKIELSISELVDPDPQLSTKAIYFALDKNWNVIISIYQNNVQITESIGYIPKYN